jgi:hypothetical protein
MAEIRIDPLTRVKQRKIQPEGLPAIWVYIGLCERCKPYKECLGLLDIGGKAWIELNEFVVSIQWPSKAVTAQE